MTDTKNVAHQTRSTLAPSRASSQAVAEQSPPIFASSLAKWALPSVTVLVAIMGYIVQSAQQDMLGIDIGLGETTTYFISAAKFTSDTGRLIAAPFIRLRLPLGGQWALVSAAALCTVAIILAPRISRARRFYRPVWLSILLAGLIAVKFLALDVALARVTNVVVGDPEKIDFTTGKPLPLGAQNGTWTASRVDGYATSLGNSIRCSRVNPDMAKLNAALQAAPECALGKQYNANRLIGTYNAHLAMMALIFIAAGMVLHFRPGRIERMLALLGILYGLSIPYAYGKLIDSTFFDFGVVHLTPTVPVEGAGPAPTQQSAVILARGSGGASLLILQRNECPGSDPKDPTRNALIARRWIAQSGFASIEQIYSTDVIKWAVSNARSCPN